MAVINYKEASITVRDKANQNIINRVNMQSTELSLFCRTADAHWAGDRILKSQAYALASFSFKANRNAFRLQPGDTFLLSYSKYDVSDMVVRVVRIEEGNLEEEDIIVFCQEDIDYISSTIDFIPEGSSGEGEGQDEDISISALTNVQVFEVSYALSGNEINILTVAARETGKEVGYKVYISTDNSTYEYVGACSSYTPHATLVDDYITTTNKIDDTSTGMVVEFTNTDYSSLETCTRAELFSGTNLMMIGNEILGWETITPISGDQYRITGVIRGRLDTEQEAHSTDADVWFVNTNFFGQFKIDSYSKGSIGQTRYFKFVPYTNEYFGDISECSVITKTIEGRALNPYKPINFKANGYDVNPTYTGDIELIWAPRKRGEGAGLNIGLEGGRGFYFWEGYFEIDIYEGSNFLRTVSGIDYVKPIWTYTQALNLADNGVLGNDITFYLTNKREEDGTSYESDSISLTVEGA